MSSTQEVGDIFGDGSGPAHAMLRSPTVLIVSVGLWGMNIFFFRLFGINYRYVLQYDLLKVKDQQQHQHQHQQQQDVPPSDIPEKIQAPSSTNSQISLSVSQSSLPLISKGKAKGKAKANESLSSTTANVNTNTNTSNVMALNSDEEKPGDSERVALVDKDDLEYYPPPSNAEGAAITWYKLVLFSMILLILLHTTTHFWMDVLGRGVIGAVLCFYATVFLYIFVPLSSNQWLRRAFWITLQRTYALLHPRCWYCRSSRIIPRPVPFIDVFYADAMCSLSKVFFDWGMLLHMASHYPHPVPQDAHNIIVPLCFAALPFLIRARQCLLMWSIGRLQNDPKRYQHVANAIKYSTSIWPLLLSAYQKTMGDAKAAQALDGYLILLQM